MQKYNTIIGKLLSEVNRKKFNKIVDKYKGNSVIKNYPIGNILYSAVSIVMPTYF